MCLIVIVLWCMPVVCKFQVSRWYSGVTWLCMFMCVHVWVCVCMLWCNICLSTCLHWHNRGVRWPSITLENRCATLSVLVLAPVFPYLSLSLLFFLFFFFLTYHVTLSLSVFIHPSILALSVFRPLCCHPNFYSLFLKPSYHLFVSQMTGFLGPFHVIFTGHLMTFPP